MIYELVKKEIINNNHDEETKATRIVALVDLLRGYERDIISEHEYMYHDDEPEQRGNLRLRLVVYAFVISYLFHFPLLWYAPRMAAFCWSRWIMFLAALAILTVFNITGALFSAWRARRKEGDGASETATVGTET